MTEAIIRLAPKAHAPPEGNDIAVPENGPSFAVELSDTGTADHAARRLAAIVESSNDAIVSKNLNGIIASWNRGAERLFGYAAEEVIGKSITILIPADRLHEENEILARVRRGELIETYETVRRRKDGSLVDVSLTISPIRNAAGLVIGASKIARDITERREAERRLAEQAQRMELLLGEIRHRVKNSLATVQAIAYQTFREAPRGERDAFFARLHALAEAHDLLTSQNWNGAPVAEVAERALAPFREAVDRFDVGGPDVGLDAGKAQLLALVLHELATNAVKYGALSVPGGKVTLHWRLSEPGAERKRLTFLWREVGGPPVKPRERKGFGSILIERAVGGDQGSADFDFAPDGVVCRINLNL